MIIGFAGSITSNGEYLGTAGAGKDEAARYAYAWAIKQGLQVRRQGWADLLKLSAARIWFPDITIEDAVAWWNLHKDSWFIYPANSGSDWISGRILLQRYGTEAHRNVFDKDFWVKALMATYDPKELLLIPDTRFHNEVDAIHQRNGEVWLIDRPYTQGMTIAADHASEKPLPAGSIDRVISNDRTLSHLRGSIEYETELWRLS